mmetsp:Transcript_20687/g.27923  ORF Transcript_20687/g.27923 Transcript_20687/m.27923 type:complete len:219 (+) Transcript_20687:196-852(+)
MRLYPGAVTFLLPRLLLTCVLGVSLYIWLFVIMIGQSIEDPITGCRKAILRVIFKIHMHLICLVSLFTVLKWKHVTPEDVGNYEEYLGSVSEQEFCQQTANEDPRVPKRGPGPASAIVCNHTGFMEIFSLIVSPLHPAFTPSIHLKSAPIFSTLTSSLGSLYIERGGSPEQRDKIVESIIERQRAIEDRCIEYPPFAVFAEATTTNNSCVFPFKRGAF